MGLDPLSLTLIGITAANTAYQINEGSKRRRIQKEANKVQGAVEQKSAQTSVRQQARKARIRQAQIEQASENTGVTGSSGMIGALAAVKQSQNAQQSYLGGQELAANAITDLNQRQSDSLYRSQVASGLTDLFQTASFAFAPKPKQ